MPITRDALPDLDIGSEVFRTDPHGVMRSLRNEMWAARSMRGIEVLSYRHCEEILGDERFAHGSSRLVKTLGKPPTQPALPQGRNLLTTEGADHSALRRVVMPWFSPKRIGGLQTATRELVDRLLDRVDSQGTCEFLEDVARILPSVVFCWMTGACEADAPQLARWSETLLLLFKGDPADVPAISAARESLGAYVGELIEAVTTRRGDDITSTLLAAVDTGDIAIEDVPALLMEMFAASTENTAHSAAVAVWLLACHPDEWHKAVVDRSIIPNAVEECGRFESAVGSTPVYNREDVVLDDVEFPGGSLSWLQLASANRDPSVFPQPDRFDISRIHARPQLTFGHGRHYCIGASLARMEVRVVLEAVTERWLSAEVGRDAIIDRSFGTTVTALPITFRLRNSS